MAEPERRPEEYDRDFHALVSGLELGGEWDGPSGAEPPDLRGRRTPPAPEPQTPLTGPGWLNLDDALERAEPDEPDPSEWKPDADPGPRLGSTAFAAVACLVGVVGILVAVIAGWRPPPWVGYFGVVLFVAAMVLGWRTLPRDRDPDDGDGAVL